MFPRSWVAGIGFACLFLASACTTPVPAPTRTALDPADPRPEAWLQAHEERAAGRSTLRGALRLSLDAPDLNFRRPQRLALRRPADLRLEVLGLFGQVAAVLVTDGSTYQSFEASRGAIESGLVTDDLLWRVARVDLQPAEAVELLLGAPRPSEGATISAAYATGDGGISLDLRDGAGRLRERVDFDARGQLADFIRYDAAERVAWQASFRDYRGRAEDVYAFDLRLRFPGVGAEARLAFDDATLHADLSDELFRLRAVDRGGKP